MWKVATRHHVHQPSNGKYLALNPHSGKPSVSLCPHCCSHRSRWLGSRIRQITDSANVAMPRCRRQRTPVKYVLKASLALPVAESFCAQENSFASRAHLKDCRCRMSVAVEQTLKPRHCRSSQQELFSLSLAWNIRHFKRHQRSVDFPESLGGSSGLLRTCPSSRQQLLQVSCLVSSCCTSAATARQKLSAVRQDSSRRPTHQV